MSKKARLALCYAAGSLGGRSGRPGSVAASAAVPGPSAGPALARPRLAHVDLATGEVPAVQRRDRLVGLARRAISTKPKPRERPVSRSVTTVADSHVPCSEKSVSRSALVVSNERFPTKSFLPMAFSCPAAGRL